ncbi:MAG: ABC transporter permease, partial [Sphingomonadales bacterium]
WRWSALDQWFQEVRHVLRQLRRSPGFAGVAVLSLALAIGANLALFSLTDTMLLRSLPVSDPEQLVEFVRADRNAMMTNLPYPVYENLREDRAVLSTVFAIAPSSEVLHYGVVPPQLTNVHEVSGSFFPTLGVPAYLGRAFGPSDDRAEAPSPVVVLSYRSWARLFGSDRAIVGQSVRLSEKLFTIIGVMPPRFFGVDRSRVPDLWIPLSLDPKPGQVWVLGRLKAGVSPARARGALEGRFRRALEAVARPVASEGERDAVLAQRLVVNAASRGTSGLRWSFWDYNDTLKILIALGGLVLLVACVNLANLLMARSAARSREVGIRLAIGAGRWRIVRQLLTENIVLSLVGGCFGVLIAFWGHGFLLDFLVQDPQTVALDFRMDFRILVFGLVLSIATGLMFGLVPALRATRADPAVTLRVGGRTPGLARVPFARVLLVGQVALSMILLFGAGLFVRSLNNLNAVDLGIERDELLLTDVRTSARTPQERDQLWSQLPARIAALRGVRSAALAGDAVFGNGGWNNTIWVESANGSPSEASVSDNWVGAGFFTTVGIPIRLGREFRDSDTPRAPLVAVVNEVFAHRFWANESPIGKHFGDNGPASVGRYEVVGVVGNAKYGNVREQLRPMVFHPVSQEPPHAMTALVLHVRGIDSADLRSSVRREVARLDGDALVSDMRSTSQVLHDQLRRDRMFAALSTIFALLALILAAIGIYGVEAYRVARRTAEIGVRMALGAQRSGVLWLVSRETLALLAVGVLLGIPLGLATMRLIKSLLFGVEASDPAALCAAVLALCAIGGTAGYLPARRAASVDPVIALREE